MLHRLWRTAPELVATAALMALVLAGSLVGLAFDPRVVAGAPAWLKPAKFAASILVYALTLGWVFTLLPAWPRLRRVVGWTTAGAMAVEIAIIAGQAARGRVSHFNVGTPLDGALFTIMGMAIFAQTFSTIAVAVALWRERFADPALGWALRLGMTLPSVGALTGGLMARPTSAQLAAARAGQPLAVAGAHTVGGPDGGPGLPGTRWSTRHGDLRVPHFVGLHSLQALPALALLLGRTGLRAVARRRLLLTGAAAYAGLYVLVLAQALRGLPLLAR